MPVFFFKAILAGGHPVIKIAKPLLQLAHVFVAERTGGLQNGNSVNHINQRPAVDNPDAATGIDAGDRLSILKIGRHTGFRVEEPGFNLLRRFLRIAVVL